MGDKRSLFREKLSGSYHELNPQRLYNVSKGSADFIQRLRIERKLTVHNGCVNSVCWNDTGQYILSGSDDQHLAITNPFTGKNIVTIHSGHRANIFAAKFLPCTQDRHVISCSGDGTIFFTEVDREDTYGQNKFDCHFGTTYEVLTVPHDPNTFLSCGEDNTVRWFDLRTKTSCTKENCKEDVLLHCRRAVTALCVNPVTLYQLGVACSDSTVRIYDRRMLGTRATGSYSSKLTTGLVASFTAPPLENRAHRITSLQYSPDGEELLVSYSSELIYLFNMKEDGKKQMEFSKELPSPEKNLAREDIPQEPQPSTSGGDVGEGGRQPPIKRLRLRGDWSDTGPNARPERERGQETESSRSVTIMQRMSDMLTRWLDGANRSGAEGEQGQGGEAGDQGQGGEAGDQGQGGEADAQPQAAEGEAGSSLQINQEPSESIPQPPPAADQDIRGSASCEAEAVSTEVPVNQEEKFCTGEELSPEEHSINSATATSNNSAESELASAEHSTEASDNIGAKHADDTSVKPDSVIDTQVKERDKAQNQDLSEIGAIKRQEKSAEPQDPRKELAQSATANMNVPQESQLSVDSGEAKSSSSSIAEVSVSNVQSIISQTILDTHIEPVISFQYNSQGTTASTIKVDFEAVEASPNVTSVSRMRDSRSPEVPALSPTETTECSSVDARKNQAQEDSPSEMCPEIERVEKKVQSAVQSDENVNVPVIDHSLTGQHSAQEVSCLTSSRPAEESTQSAQIATEDLSVPSPSEKQLAEAPGSVSEAETSAQDQKVQPPLSEEEEDHSFDDFTDYDTATEEHDETEAAEKKSDDHEASADPPKVTITTVADPSEDDPDQPSTSEEGAVGGIDVTDEKAYSSHQDGPRRLPVRPRGATGVSSSTRQRRMGHSGPPTGDFQLHSASDDDEDDSDSELMRAAERSRTTRDNMERNLAAVKLQELYRKRCDMREKEEQEIMGLKKPAVKQVFRGHRNARTMIKEAGFWGEHYVMSGSDCGHIFIWDRYTAKLVMLLEGDRHVVNCVQPHPYYPVLASSGIDYDVKIWMPTSDEPNFQSQQAHEVMRRNEIMLEETRDTITVPASFMLRMLASLNNIRAGRRSNQQEEEDSSSSSDDEGFANNLFNDDNNNDSNNNI